RGRTTPFRTVWCSSHSHSSKRRRTCSPIRRSIRSGKSPSSSIAPPRSSRSPKLRESRQSKVRLGDSAWIGATRRQNSPRLLTLRQHGRSSAMETAELLRREVKALAFDQYGTIVDMQKGLTAAVTPFLKDKGWDGKANSFVTWWRRTHFENSMIDALCDRGHTPYRQIGERAVSYVMNRCGIPYTPDQARWLVSEIEKL